MARVILFPQKVQAKAQSSAFPLVEKVATVGAFAAARRTPVRTAKPYDRRATGRLKRSMKKKPTRILIGSVKSSFGSSLPYADSIERGAKRHIIRARTKPNLVFYWARHDVTFVGKKVNHPGVRRPYHMLEDAAKQVARSNNFIYRRITGDLTG